MYTDQIPRSSLTGVLPDHTVNRVLELDVTIDRWKPGLHQGIRYMTVRLTQYSFYIFRKLAGGMRARRDMS